MGFYDGPGQEETQPGAFGHTSGFRRSIKSLEHIWDVTGCETGSLVAHADYNEVRPYLPVDDNFTGG
jgi:hypothetical protein